MDQVPITDVGLGQQPTQQRPAQGADGLGSGAVGLVDGSAFRGTLRFVVYGNGKKIAASSKAAGTGSPATIDIDVTSVVTLELIVYLEGQAESFPCSNSNAVWGDARLER